MTVQFSNLRPRKGYDFICLRKKKPQNWKTLANMDKNDIWGRNERSADIGLDILVYSISQKALR